MNNEATKQRRENEEDSFFSVPSVSFLENWLAALRD
jgi:hypothetical protein